MRDVHIRWLIRNDVQDVLMIDPEYNEEELLRDLRKRNIIGMVSVYTVDNVELITGYMIYELKKHSLNITRFMVDADFRRTGIGRQMVDKLIGKLSENTRTRLTVNVDEYNLRAQQFFRAMGFRAVNVRGSDTSYKFVYTLKNPGRILSTCIISSYLKAQPND